jgi:hypothetical protein
MSLTIVVLAAGGLAWPFSPAPIRCRWYTAEELHGIGWTDDAKENGLLFLVVSTTIPGNMLDVRRMTPQELEEFKQPYNASATVGWRCEVLRAQFKLHMPDGSTQTALGDCTLGHSPADMIYQSVDKPVSLYVAVFFGVRRSDVERGGLKFQYKNQSSVTLNSTNREASPAPSKRPPW